jgi:hypothetical protein
MKKFTIAVFALFAGLAVHAQGTLTPAPAPAAAPAAPVQAKDISKYVEIKNAEYNFGKIPFGKSAEYEVEVKNISKTETVTIERVQAGCGCTTPKYEANKKLAPGETAKITLGFNGSSDGAFTKFVTIFFNDGMSKAVSFKGETYKTPDTPAPSNDGVQKMKG